MFKKILVANRGEIAVRVIRACKEMGVGAVAVFSEADREALHVSLADESYCIGGALSKDSYLNMENIISAAIAARAEGIHPGYGFLSENARFAAMCREHGVAFIGPEAETIARMGDKLSAKRAMKEAGLPVIPGGDLSDGAEAAAEAEKTGYPLLIKARAGGGGRGIRLVKSADLFLREYRYASLEAANAFGDGSLYAEKYLSPVKHIEVQILADNYGNVAALGERDCSAQRKNQKLIEESPAAALSEKTRRRLYAASISAAEKINYRSAGTIEFLMDAHENFYFLEMNTRLQVEHPVTEMVTGVDLVKWQIRIAAGATLDFSQKDVTLNGCAIECRINAEDAYQNFKPSAGRVNMLHIPGGPWVRFDTAVYHGYAVPPFYDSNLGKLIVWAKTRDEAVRKMKAALCELIIEGVAHNADFLLDILSRPEFENGNYDTNILSTMLKDAGHDI